VGEEDGEEEEEGGEEDGRFLVRDSIILSFKVVGLVGCSSSSSSREGSTRLVRLQACRGRVVGGEGTSSSFRAAVAAAVAAVVGVSRSPQAAMAGG
jgi:hypothetical protein